MDCNIHKTVMNRGCHYQEATGNVFVSDALRCGETDTNFTAVTRTPSTVIAKCFLELFSDVVQIRRLISALRAQPPPATLSLSVTLTLVLTAAAYKLVLASLVPATSYAPRTRLHHATTCTCELM